MVSLPQRTRLVHTTPPWVGSGEIFFITICCVERKTNQLALPPTFQVMTGALEHYVRAEKFWVHLFLAMPDHLHALMAFPENQRMDKVLRDWKRFVAKQAKVAWQDGFFDHRLRNDEALEEKAHYVRMNPVRAGLVATPERWDYTWPQPAVSPAR